MKKAQSILAFILIIILLPISFTANAAGDKGGKEKEDKIVKRMIVAYTDENLSDAQRDEVLGKQNVKRLKRLNKEARADVVEITDEEVVTLRKNAKVKFVEKDVEVQTLAQTIPWGVDRIDAEKTFSNAASGVIVKVAVIDTGISLSHPDLIVRGGVNTINPWKNPNDDNGHGSHVAGAIAATNNSLGVVGVAPVKTYLYAVKALNASGGGYVSDIIEGLDWCVANGMRVANMSLGTSAYSQALQDAVRRAKTGGVTLVAAAGNSGGAVLYPAAFPEVIAVGATDNMNTVAYFSSRGPQLDVVAPGVNIYSTYKGKTYATISGTSMAAPHVAGVAALLISNPSKCQFLLDTTAGCSPDEVQKRIEQTAEQLPSDAVTGKDSVYGSGLVDAERAVLGT